MPFSWSRQSVAPCAPIFHGAGGLPNRLYLWLINHAIATLLSVQHSYYDPVLLTLCVWLAVETPNLTCA